MSTSDKIHVVGIGENGLDGLTAAARELIENAQVLVGDEHALASLPAGPIMPSMLCSSTSRLMLMREGLPSNDRLKFLICIFFIFVYVC